ncbi:metalloregulator ArsR/SmtB family transcription factor [Corynebacterium sp. CCM 8835]|uniref:Winged helix-turn-helix transcriptional regulator n=1 Tax=Corynebacterium antarcticum TaxID=2800405 RepID=A0ABS1FLJ9_9CORY|nr:metalloregulator ArsR/SmtB family transcription factor [Corynebacterium antarcticum]MCK7642689.1 metalloregulator ArsR/SmtB family transcription factor [Corynebacterium antarcticum]MCK7660623.1 metalloregulator ArsR/SmtB family transcription factor [Corynebacterium antarcticum]MCL0245369.1 metalloregulator ArsR/SmtB family transcription factor [Corynebacterium antarcticum]MCX7492176.1 metalloregulator ArsR/SmtB family transcription factor [Corynebacterium antarcticum]MCX7539939.1 metalloreg
MSHIEAHEQALVRLGRALADPTRCRLLLAILDGNHYPAQLAEQLGLSRANVSNHLACLRDCGLVRTHPEGRKVRYVLAGPELAESLRNMTRIVLTVCDDSETCLNKTPVEANR